MATPTERYHNHGIYADLIKQYIAHKRSLGYKMEDIEERLGAFDRLTIDRKETVIGITKDLYEAYAQHRPMESRYNLYGRLSMIKSFSRYLQLMGYESYIPVLPKYRSTFTPHIYTKSEMSAIFHECDKLYVARHYMYSMKCMMPALIRLLYGTGIRIGEALKLKNADIDLQQGLIMLRECKNGQDRLLPLSLSVREICKDYAAYKLRCGLQAKPDRSFFTSPDGHSPAESTIYKLFQTVLIRAGIHYEGGKKGPRLHDLRHTFCVNALVKMSEAGQDLYYSMPVLMTYMGHKSLSATNRYVRLTEEMYPGLLKQVDATHKYVFPDIGVNLEEEENEDD